MSRILRVALLLAFLGGAGAAAEDVAVQVESDPPGARVYDRTYQPGSDRGFLGVTPLQLRTGASLGQVLWFELPGYSTLRASLEPGQTRLRVELQPASPAAWLGHAFRSSPQVAVPAALGLLALVGASVLGVRRQFRRLQTRLAESEERGPDLVGKSVGDYRVLGVVGTGSFGRVLKVRHEQYGDEYALKLLNAEVTDPEQVERFDREVRVGRDLLHPNVTRAFAFGEHRGAPYLVMEYLEGETLRKRLDRGPLTPEEAVGIARQVARGLAAAHARGIVHRDLKPANLMILTDGTVKIMDFGVARLQDSRQVTATGMALGTPFYMSPEHLRAKEMDGRSDLYSLGVILFEALTGTVPFTGDDTYAVLAGHLSEDPPAPSERASGIPRWLDELVLQLLEKDPSRRPASAEDLLAALEGVPR